MATGVRIDRPVSRFASLPAPVPVLIGLATTAGVIHVAAMIEHVSNEWTLPVFFGFVGALQLFTGWWLYREPQDLRVPKAMALISVGVAVLWILSRTTGLPLGPESGKVASVGAADTIVQMHQLAFAAIVFSWVRRPADAQPRLVAWLSSEIGIRFTFAALWSTLLVAAMAGHEH